MSYVTRSLCLHTDWGALRYLTVGYATIWVCTHGDRTSGRTVL